jgi:addiction module HigA family antidote
MAKRKFDPVHPGVVLAEDFLKGLEISQYRLAKGISVSARRINEIVQGKRSITADTALRLAKFFGMEAQFWMNLQSHYDLEIAKDAIAGKLDREVEVLKAAPRPRRRSAGAHGTARPLPRPVQSRATPLRELTA